MAKRKSEDEKMDTGRWLTTYADMMNNLLVLFMVLYAMSILDKKKFEALSSQLNNAFNKIETVEAVAEAAPSAENGILEESNDVPSLESEQDDSFDRIYETIKKEIIAKGYEGLISAEKGDNYITFKFGDSTLFYPDKSVIKNESYDILSAIGNILKSVDSLTRSIEIGGHTATTGEYTDSFFSWELSSDRAIAVLKYLVNNCGLPESKMSVSGFSRYRPIASNDTEESRQYNRRVEVKITRITKDG